MDYEPQYLTDEQQNALYRLDNMGPHAPLDEIIATIYLTRV